MSFIKLFPSTYRTQIINPFFSSMISANHNKLIGLKSLYTLLFLYGRISFVLEIEKLKQKLHDSLREEGLFKAV